MNEGRPLEIEMDTTTTNVLARALQWIQSSRIILVHVLWNINTLVLIYMCQQTWQLVHGSWTTATITFLVSTTATPTRDSHDAARTHETTRPPTCGSPLLAPLPLCLREHYMWTSHLSGPHVIDSKVGVVRRWSSVPTALGGKCNSCARACGAPAAWTRAKLEICFFTIHTRNDLMDIVISTCDGEL